jgi:hypothetical protein
MGLKSDSPATNCCWISWWSPYYQHPIVSQFYESGKIQYFTHLNSSAIWERFPYCFPY